MDREAWRATVHEAAKSWDTTELKLCEQIFICQRLLLFFFKKYPNREIFLGFSGNTGKISMGILK